MTCDGLSSVSIQLMPPMYLSVPALQCLMCVNWYLDMSKFVHIGAKLAFSTFNGLLWLVLLLACACMQGLQFAFL